DRRAGGTAPPLVICLLAEPGPDCDNSASHSPDPSSDGTQSMAKLIRSGVDSVSAVLLATVLLVGYLADTGPPPPGPVVGTKGDGSNALAGSAEPPKKKLRLAVTPGTFDNMGALLEGLGKGYEFETVEEAALSDPAECRQFDAIFLTCTEGAGS